MSDPEQGSAPTCTALDDVIGPPEPMAPKRRSRSQRVFHKRWCLEHRQQEVCLCTLGVDHQERRTTRSKSLSAQALWCERVNRAHRAAWVHERNVRAWARVYGRNAPGADAYVGTYESALGSSQGAISGTSQGLQRVCVDELALLVVWENPWP